ncbi:hypothetical protein THIOSC15_2710003 [uncultured Thiomicrorhabdus sp.]
MANEFNDKVWILDTASTTEVLKGVFGKHQIVKVHWKPSASGETLTIQDKDGNTRLTDVSLAATAAGNIEWDFPPDSPPEVFGFVLHTLGGGTVYVYFK